jgi:hypothetical protein
MRRLLCISNASPRPCIFQSYPIHLTHDIRRERGTSLTAFGALITLSTLFLISCASFFISLDETQGGGLEGAVPTTLGMTLRDPEAQDDFVCRRMIVCDAEMINGIGGGMVGRRYLGVPRAIISLYPHRTD